MPDLNLPQRTILLDGGMGRELRFRGVDVMASIRSAKALIEAPQVVREVHRDFIAAGADIITINSYSRGFLIMRQKTCKRGNGYT